MRIFLPRLPETPCRRSSGSLIGWRPSHTSTMVAPKSPSIEPTAVQRQGLAALHPGNFALVMASAILAQGFHLHALPKVGRFLDAFALFAFVVLMALSLARVVFASSAVRDDLTNPRLVFGFFTLVAAASLVGQIALGHGQAPVAMGLWAFAFVVWCLLLYLAFAVLTFLTHEHNVNIVHGGWLIAIVGTQSLVVLGARLVPELGEYGRYMQVEVHMLWGLGLCLYGIFVTLFCYRIFFLRLAPDDVGPLLWVVMGAAAISANAGTALIALETPLPFLAAQRPFVDGVTMMIWAWATWWIPLLTLFGVWKHGINRRPLRYEPIMWSLVFPLGMYAVASARLGLAADFEPLGWISTLVLAGGSLAWVVVMMGLLRRLGRRPWRPRIAPEN
ncbi:tellurite resistance/C4-dicarboxylate transporter family protein [Silanimonas sp.]|uniref:tellurite resistance/C4-dicarboxylate transporter family protein n=1 Tax=Silanimonas sp. TaxID=1929290 RepID=UPI0022CC3A76|nr:tellurite resistance/C4-dicarboxylate transporter family protein [Silanimonas sp.]MCZ8166561.1 tellurite resistance/C4-dicarboxylate transporter family protein [Silanimonas sp.]